MRYLGFMRGGFTTACALAVLSGVFSPGLHAAGPPMPDPAASQKSVVAASNRFAFQLLERLHAQRPAGNTLISAFSIAAALTMTWNGARGVTAEAMSGTLGLAGLDWLEIDRGWQALLAQLQAEDSGVRLDTAQAVWVRAGNSLDETFRKRLQVYFGALAETLNFADPAAAARINGWVAEHTQDKITQLVGPEQLAQSIMAVINAVYFNGTWSKPFDSAQTRDLPFTLADGTQRRQPMMSQSGRYRYLETEDFQAVSLPYAQGQAALYVFLPAPGSSLDAFRAKLDAEHWQAWLAAFENERRGTLVLPRFKVEFGADLVPILKNLGMAAACAPGADFGGIGAGDLYISSVIHKTFLAIDETGTEAAAATAVLMTRGVPQASPEPPFSMRVDRPFFYAIRDEFSGLLLFAGFAVEPRALVDDGPQSRP